MSAYQRRKGHNFEREVVRYFKKHLPDHVYVQRGLQSRNGDECPDVGIYNHKPLDSNAVPSFWIECKRGKKTNWRNAIGTAVKEGNPDSFPVGIAKDDREEPVAILLLDDFTRIIRLALLFASRQAGELYGSPRIYSSRMKIWGSEDGGHEGDHE